MRGGLDQSRISLPRKPGWEYFADACLDVAAHYTAATAKREQEGLPCIGLCLDRRQQSQVAEAVHRDNIKSYISQCCAQIRTYVRNWECAYDCSDTLYKGPDTPPRR